MQYLPLSTKVLSVVFSNERGIRLGIMVTRKDCRSGCRISSRSVAIKCFFAASSGWRRSQSTCDERVLTIWWSPCATLGGKQPSFVFCFHDQQPLRQCDELPSVVTVLWRPASTIRLLKAYASKGVSLS